MKALKKVETEKGVFWKNTEIDQKLLDLIEKEIDEKTNRKNKRLILKYKRQ